MIIKLIKQLFKCKKETRNDDFHFPFMLSINPEGRAVYDRSHIKNTSRVIGKVKNNNND